MIDLKETFTSINLLSENTNSHHIERVYKIGNEEFIPLIEFLNNHLGYRQILDITFYQSDREICFWLFNIENSNILGIVVIGQDTFLRDLSLAHLYKNFDSLLMSCEKRLFAVKAGLNRNERPGLTPFKEKKSVLKSYVDTREWSEVRISTKFSLANCLKFGVTSVEGKILNLDFKSFEIPFNLDRKYCAKKFYTLCEDLLKLDGLNSIFVHLGLIMAREKSLNLEIPDKAKAVRMIYLEFARVYVHTEYIAHMASENSDEQTYYACLYWMQIIQKILMFNSQNSFHLGVFTVGGLQRDIQKNWITKSLEDIRSLSDRVNLTRKKVLSSFFLKNHLSDIGCFSKQDLFDWGVYSSNIRASGLNYDFRREAPFYFYDEVTFSTPLGQSGSAYDRMILSFFEIEQSLNIIQQVFESIPPGSFLSEYLKEEILNHEEVVTFFLMEGGGELYKFCIKTKGEDVLKIKITSESLSKLSFLCSSCKGEAASDLLSIYKSFHIRESMLRL